MAYREVTMVEVNEVRQWLASEPKKRVAKRLSLSPSHSSLHQGRLQACASDGSLLPHA